MSLPSAVKLCSFEQRPDSLTRKVDEYRPVTPSGADLTEMLTRKP
jgi:hypothetical protein